MDDRDDRQWLCCPRCGREAVETEWNDVTAGNVSLFFGTAKCPDCWVEGHAVDPLPLYREPILITAFFRGIQAE